MMRRVCIYTYTFKKIYIYYFFMGPNTNIAFTLIVTSILINC